MQAISVEFSDKMDLTIQMKKWKYLITRTTINNKVRAKEQLLVLDPVK